MGLFDKMLDNINMDNLQGMIPQKREIADYKIIRHELIKEFNNEAKELIDQGYEPIGILIVKDSPIYIKEFIKYKPITKDNE